MWFGAFQYRYLAVPKTKWGGHIAPPMRLYRAAYLKLLTAGSQETDIQSFLRFTKTELQAEEEIHIIQHMPRD